MPKSEPQPTIRASAVRLRSYHRPEVETAPDDERYLETWEAAVDRVIFHQRWLWERAQGKVLIEPQVEELNELRDLILQRKVAPAGRTLWLGGTETARTRESSMFNCAHTLIVTHYDLVDAMWLLLQGCGVGFTPVTGCLHGYQRMLEDIEVVRSTRTSRGGQERNSETFDYNTGTWTITVGDSAEAWAKAVGKLVIGQFPARKLVLDLSQIRPAGFRLKGYGWISSGDAQIAKAFPAIAKILSARTETLLTKIDILDIVNWMGTILSSRRSAEIALVEYDSPEWEAFAVAKKDYWLSDNGQRQSSNNSLVFERKPNRQELEQVFGLITDSGGSEPGFINAVAARERAPWFKGVNPCAEILLGDKSFCNLSEINLPAFRNDLPGLKRAIYLTGRMNYRQTCVDLRDGILQEAWHTNNQFLRLCGVGLTGITARTDLTPYEYRMLRRLATDAAQGMARELNLPIPKNITTIKPSGTLSKIMGDIRWGEVPEGVHRPQARYLFNWINFSKGDPLIALFETHGYKVLQNPTVEENMLVCFPVAYDNVKFTKKKCVFKVDPLDRSDDAKTFTEVVEVDTESAVDQLERYRMLMSTYVDQNASATIYYNADEVGDIIEWLLKHWDSYVGVSWCYRSDPTTRPEDVGYPYLPQQAVSKSRYDEYTKGLKKIDFSIPILSVDMPENTTMECAGGACPIK